MDKNSETTAPVKVSVIVPVFNAGLYLRECLDSIINQTFMDIEVICVDDGSTDDSLNIIKEYAHIDSRVKIIIQKNQYAGVARNNGMKVAEGDYLLFLDADDFFDLTLVETTYKQIKKDDADICLFASESYDNQRQSIVKGKETIRVNLLPKRKPFSYRDIPNRIFNVSQCVPWNKLFRKKFILEHGLEFEPRRFANDNYFCCLSMVKAQRITYVTQPLTIHRKGLAENLQSLKAASPLDFYYAGLEVKKELIRMGIYDKVKQGFSNWSRWNSFYYLRTMKSKTAADIVREKLLKEGHDTFDIIGRDELLFFYKDVYREYKEAIRNLSKNDSRVPNTEDSALFYKGIESNEFINFDSKPQNQVKISVIIPVRNSLEHLCECLDTIINQTLHDIEIICVDDGSKDASLIILKEYARKDSRIKIIIQENQYAGIARNNGIKMAQGEYLLFLDAKNIFDSKLLEKTYQRIKKDNADICLFSFNNYNDITKKVIKTNQGLKAELLPDKVPFSHRDIPKYIFNISTVAPLNKLFRKDFILHHKIKFEPRCCSNDIYFNLLAMAKAERITYVNEKLMLNRREFTDDFQNVKEDYPLDFYYAYNAIKDELQSMNVFNMLKQSFLNHALCDMILHINSLKTGAAFAVAYDKVKEFAFKEFDIEGQDESYFYDLSCYMEYISIRDLTDIEYLHHKLKQELTTKQNRGLHIYKIGGAIAVLPRKIRSGILCLKYYGLEYTCQLLLKKIISRLKS